MFSFCFLSKIFPEPKFFNKEEIGNLKLDKSPESKNIVNDTKEKSNQAKEQSNILQEVQNQQEKRIKQLEDKNSNIHEKLKNKENGPISEYNSKEKTSKSNKELAS